ncbi:MAG: PAS domain-containing sensor histidine kinase [Gammaproteobacteria bacterium]|nr:PAS domain-containing sensor histidine kinase [Gammaproteobacteria bacterium]
MSSGTLHKIATEDDKIQTVDWTQTASVLNAMPSGVVVCDSNGIIAFGNSELAKQFGYEIAELIGKPVDILIPKPFVPTHHKNIQQYIDAPRKRQMGTGQALFGLRKDETTFPIEIGLNPIETSTGLQVIATVIDISQRVQIENNFKSMFEYAPVGMLMIDETGVIQHCNKQFTSVFGYDENELKGLLLEVLIPERYRNGHTGFRKNYLKSPSTRSMGSDRDLTGLHKSGTEIPVEIGLNPIKTENGMSVIATIIDVTERKVAELKLKQANADLDEFTYVASHDLKSPLRGINTLIEWIEEDLGEEIPEDVKHNLERVHIRIDRMEKLIEDLLTYARSGRESKSITTFYINQVLQNIIDVIEIPSGIKITIEGYDGKIQASAAPLETVLRNLITNAIKHHDKEEGNILVNVKTDDSYCIFEVRDDGPGIPKNAHERIFKIFQSLKNEEGSRSGVGLAVCKRLVESHSGSIEVESDEGEGSCFRFWWPRFARRDITTSTGDI